MSFRVFIYYCALCGGWAAFLAWAFATLLGIQPRGAHQPRLPELATALVAGLLGAFVAAAIGGVDAVLNAVGAQRLLRVGVCFGIGLVGGAVGGFIGEALHFRAGLPVFIGWILVGLCIGASIGVYDLLLAAGSGGEMRAPLKKTLNGLYGGLLGGFLGGLPFGLIVGADTTARSPLTIGLVLLGTAVGLMVGLAQVVLKEAWIKIEKGFRAGREVLLTKDETLIGRAEACDVGIFGDMDIEKEHASILLKGGRYLLTDHDTAKGTYLNDRRINGATELASGDLIRVGNCYLRFGERQKRR